MRTSPISNPSHLGHAVKGKTIVEKNEARPESMPEDEKDAVDGSPTRSPSPVDAKANGKLEDRDNDKYKSYEGLEPHKTSSDVPQGNTLPPQLVPPPIVSPSSIPPFCTLAPPTFVVPPSTTVPVIPSTSTLRSGPLSNEQMLTCRAKIEELHAWIANIADTWGVSAVTITTNMGLDARGRRARNFWNAFQAVFWARTAEEIEKTEERSGKKVTNGQ